VLVKGGTLSGKSFRTGHSRVNVRREEVLEASPEESVQGKGLLYPGRRRKADREAKKEGQGGITRFPNRRQGRSSVKPERGQKPGLYRRAGRYSTFAIGERRRPGSLLLRMVKCGHDRGSPGDLEPVEKKEKKNESSQRRAIGVLLYGRQP